MKHYKELHLLEKRRKGPLALLTSRTGVVLILLAMAVLSLASVLVFFGDYIAHILGGVELFNMIVIIALFNTDMDSSAKLTWGLVIALTSVFGAMFFLYTRVDVGSGAVHAEYNRIIEAHRDELAQDDSVMEDLRKTRPETAQLAEYVNRGETYPISRGNEVKYYPLGEEKWADMLPELEKAEKFIFMEYFIVEEGTMWGSILNILQRKAAEGVDVRVMYDGTCALSTLPYDYPEKLRALGIQCKMFSPLRVFVSTYYNYRDHRKILVVDGRVGFCGGVNLADEYINRVERFGHWKDTAVRVKGEAVRSLTHMFLNMWTFGEKNPDYATFMNAPVEAHPEAKGYVMPYGFNPFSGERVGESVYIDILNRAKRYVHIMTPYLILDDELLHALRFAAKRGVDVRIILPGIPDKKAVYALAKTYFKTLMDAGVKIYLYTPGFVHAKVFVCDDERAVVGTINLDYRSLYHHFECAVYMAETDCIPDIERDYAQTQELCALVTEETLRSQRISEKITGRVARLVAPLL